MLPNAPQHPRCPGLSQPSLSEQPESATTPHSDWGTVSTSSPHCGGHRPFILTSLMAASGLDVCRVVRSHSPTPGSCRRPLHKARPLPSWLQVAERRGATANDSSTNSELPGACRTRHTSNTARKLSRLIFVKNFIEPVPLWAPFTNGGWKG